MGTPWVSKSTPQEDIDPASWTDPSVTYDSLAAPYARTFVNELDAKPFDRELLSRFSGALRQGSNDRGLVCDLGCGPGHVGAFLAERGLAVVGIDRSRGMVKEARRHAPSMPLCQGDMSDLGLLESSLRGIVCFYALIHIPRVMVSGVLRELRRVLAPGGALLVAVHGGEGALHATEMLDQPVNLDFTLFSLPELSELLAAAGFDLVEQHERDPYAHEAATRRLYLWAIRRA